MERKQMATKQSKATAPDMGPQQIVILDRGWVLVGNACDTGDKVHVTDARCIRYWGTTRGLGQLAESGPTDRTRLDPMGTVIAPMRAVIAIVACKTAW
jgi:hypothetical protein